jgi:serine protease
MWIVLRSLNRGIAAFRRNVDMRSSATPWLLLALGMIHPLTPHATEAKTVPTRFIVHFDNVRAATAAVQSTVTRRATAGDTLPVHVRSLSAGGEVFDVPDGDIGHLARMPGVTDIEEDRVVTPTVSRPGLWHRQWYMHDPRVGIDAEVAWRYTRGAGSVVAVLDTGMTSHPQLDGQWLPGYDFVTDAAAARDGDGRDADPTDEGDWVEAGDCDPPSKPAASSWHGTHVAGIIGARYGDGRGMLGIADEAKLVPVRVMARCGGRLSDVIDGASGGEVPGVPAIARRADAINLSLGTPGACGKALSGAVEQARSRGSAVIAAAGNDGIKASVVSPANCPGVITVGALGRDGAMAWYSNHGESVTLVAPGGSLTAYGVDDILSTVDAGKRRPERPLLKYYAGTSMAAPQVSALVALMRSADPTIDVDTISRQLIDNARPVPGACPKGCGAGLMDAGATVDAVVEDRTER